MKNRTILEAIPSIGCQPMFAFYNSMSSVHYTNCSGITNGLCNPDQHIFFVSEGDIPCWHWHNAYILLCLLLSLCTSPIHLTV